MLTCRQLESFDQNGFLVVENVVADAELKPLENEYDVLLDAVIQTLQRHGVLSDVSDNACFGDRFSQLISQCPSAIDYFNISLPLINGRINADSYLAHTGPAVFSLLRHPGILDVVEAVIGGEIASSPVQQMRMKPPQKDLGKENIAHSGVGLTTWHQDTVAVLEEAADTNQVTVWLAITDADENNGCLVSIPGSHLEGAQRHVAGVIPREPTVPESIIKGRQGQPLPVKRGGLVIFHKQNIHSSLPNRSDRLRWSMDIRYHPTGQPSGRPAFPGFIARSRSDPSTELTDPVQWAQLWEESRKRILRGEYKGPIFRDWRQESVPPETVS